MKLRLLSTSRGVDGLYDVDVSIDGKMYTYHIASSYAMDLFMSHYNSSTKRHGRALAILNRFKEVTNE